MQNFNLFIETVSKNFKKPSLPILESVFLNDGEITYTNNIVRYTVKTNLTKGIKILIDFKFIQKISKLKILSFQQDGINLIINTKKGIYKTKELSPFSNYPVLSEQFKLIEYLTNVETGQIISLIPYASNDKTRPVMCGVWVNEYICASNSHILKYYKRNNPINSFIIPDYALNFIHERSYDVLKSKDYYCLKNEIESLIFIDIEGLIPEFLKVIPKDKEFTEVKTNVSVFNNVIYACNLIGKLNFRLQIKNNIKTSFEKDDYSFTSEINAEINGEYKELYLPSKQLDTLLKTEKFKEVTLKVFNEMKAILVNQNIIIMPTSLRDYENY